MCARALMREADTEASSSGQGSSWGGKERMAFSSAALRCSSPMGGGGAAAVVPDEAMLLCVRA
jgi:hypothetical protein